MPNHIHAVVWITNNETVVGATGRSPKITLARRSLGSFIAGFKGQSAAQINRLRGTVGQPVWQRNYFERIIRNDREYSAIISYIECNPTRWEEDGENPNAARRLDDLEALLDGSRPQDSDRGGYGK